MAVVVEPLTVEGLVAIRIAKDPFPVLVKKSQLSPCDAEGNVLESNPKDRISSKARKDKETMAETKAAPTAKQLRKMAQALGIKGADEMSKDDLAKAVRKAQKAEKSKGAKGKPAKVSKDEAVKAAEDRAASKKKGKKASAAKSTEKAKPSAKASKPEGSKTKPSKTKPSKEKDPSNPFRPGSNLHIICGLLIRGGKRQALALKLQEKAQLHPYSGSEDEVGLSDYDKRIILASQTLEKKHGFTVERDGRGLDGTIKVFPPSEKKAKTSKGKSKKK